MRRILLGWLLMQVVLTGYTQTNTDPTQGYINVVTPKTPESSGFEKFGKYDVNEFTGTANISIPIYTLSSRHLSVPITLSYHPTGIKVNEEASWVGLGWDLIAGGRITVETRGSVDFSSGSVSGNGPSSNTAREMKRIQKHFNGGGELAVATFATIFEPDDNGSGTPWSDIDSNLDILSGIEDMDEFGTGEPDIFRANFQGHSFTFYFDKITGAINFIGERTLFNIIPQFDAPHINILGWEIIDNQGVQYYFNQTELNTNTNTSNPVVPPTTVTAWLLTKIVHPDGDYIQFTYANYGYSVPAFTMGNSITYSYGSNASAPLDTYQWPVLQSPEYLTKIETSNAAINFTLGNRTDLYGLGSRKLTNITVTDKITGIVKKTIQFNYSYFRASPDAGSQTYLNSLSYSLPSPLSANAYLACSSQRLRLDSVNINDGTYEPPYRFSYNAITADKYTMSQDHWGYFNAVNNTSGGSTGNSFTHLIPYFGFFGVQSVVNQIPAVNWSFVSIGNSRDCDPNYSQAMMLTHIVYPTGGSTSFVYEPHQSTMAPTTPVTGGGLRIKSISNYSATGNLLGTTSYTYSGGKYMGNIEYNTTLAQLPSCSGQPSPQGTINFNTYGAKCDNDILIGYAQITVTETDPDGNINGSLVKMFNINTPSSSYSYNGAGITAAMPYCPPSWASTGGSCSIDLSLQVFSTFNAPNTITDFLGPTAKGFAPTPSANLEGKLLQEQYFDNNGNMLKSVNYYYHLANYSNNFYSVKAIQNRVGGFNIYCPSGIKEEAYNGNRPVILFISPAKSYFTLKDSVVEIDYSGKNSISKKTAYQYNSYYQPMFETVYNSDGTQTIHYTRTAAEIYVPQASAASGTPAIQMYRMISQHAIDLPIEQTVIHRGTAGDSTVISSRFNVYNNTLPLQVYSMESPTPLSFRSQFVPWYYVLGSSYSVAIDPHYSLYSTADYSSNNMIWTLHTLAGNKAFIWDENYNLMMAQCSNSDSGNVAFTSFETQAQGRWVYNQSAVAPDNSAPTGGNVFALSAPNAISIGALANSTTYIVSYWSKTGSSYAVSGTASIKQGKTVNGWTYFEHTISGVTSVTISGAGSIDEVRLYPSTSQMISYTYFPLIGITSQCDADNRISYYFYDGIGRLKWIKDQDGNIIKTFQYHYLGQNGISY